jgi:hypothetical protein
MWLLVIVTVGGVTGIAVATLALVRRRFPQLQQHELNDVIGVGIGVLAAIYGILLGFITVALYQDFTDAKATVRVEATQLVQLYEDSLAFPKPTSAAVQKQINGYITTVRGREWDAMRDGKLDLASADDDIAGIYRVLRSYEPETATQRAFYADALTQVNAIVASRSARLSYAAEELPATFRLVLVVGGLLLLASLHILNAANRRLHELVVAGVAVLTSFVLLIVVALDHPFSGHIAVSKEPFSQQRLQSLQTASGSAKQP